MIVRGTSGYACLTGPIQTRETDTFTCSHCNKVVHVHWGERNFTRCGVCDTLICEQCRGKGCDPFEKKLARQIAAMELYQKITRGG